MDESIKSKITDLELGKKTTIKYNGVKLSILKGSYNLFIKAKQPWIIILTSIITFFFIIQTLAYFISYERELDDGTVILFSGQGFLIETVGKYPFISLAFFIIVPILLSSVIYNYTQRSKIKNFKKEYSQFFKKKND